LQDVRMGRALAGYDCAEKGDAGRSGALVAGVGSIVRAGAAAASAPARGQRRARRTTAREQDSRAVMRPGDGRVLHFLFRLRPLRIASDNDAGYLPIITSEALITAQASSPFCRPRSATRRDDHAMAEVNTNMRGSSPLADVHNFSLELIACTELHSRLHQN